MANELTSTAQIPQAVRIFYHRTMLKNARAKLHHAKFGDVINIPANSGDTVKMRRYATLSTATTPLAEGVTPPATLLSKSDYTARVSQYGAWTQVTDVCQFTNIEKPLVQAKIELGDQQGRTIDEITRDILVACASSTNASGGSNSETPTEITKADIDAIVQTLVGNDAEMFTPIIKASTGVGTSPVRDAFWGIMHTDLLDDLEDVSNFRNISQYPSGGGVDGEWGATGNVRWLLSTVAHKSSDETAQYYLPIIGKHAYCTTEISILTSKSIIKPFGHGEDRLDQRASAGWKQAYVSRITNDNYMHVLKVTHS